MGGAFLATFIQFLLIAVWLLVLGRILMSYVDPQGRNQASGYLYQATEPILAPIRRILPQTGTVDWSGFVVLIVLGFLWRAFESLDLPPPSVSPSVSPLDRRPTAWMVWWMACYAPGSGRRPWKERPTTR